MPYPDWTKDPGVAVDWNRVADKRYCPYCLHPVWRIGDSSGVCTECAEWSRRGLTAEEAEALECARGTVEEAQIAHRLMDACDNQREGVTIGLVDDEATVGCGACEPSLHDHDCCVCDGQREVQDESAT